MRVLVIVMSAVDICCTSAMSRAMIVVMRLAICEGVKCSNISKQVTNIICTYVYTAEHTAIQKLFFIYTLYYCNSNLKIKTTPNYTLHIPAHNVQHVLLGSNYRYQDTVNEDI
jgi:hypothetical protein